MRLLRPFFAFARLTQCDCSPSLIRAVSTSWQIRSVGAPRYWAPSGLSQEVCQELFRRWLLTIDLFATSLNHRLPAYFPRWWIRSQREQTQCFSLGTICRPTCFPVRPQSSSALQGAPFSQPGSDVGSPFLATQTLVPRSSGTAGGGSGRPAYVEGSTQTAPLSSFPYEPPCASVDWLSYCERSARSLGFCSKVAHQLTVCRCSSTRVNYREVVSTAWSFYFSPFNFENC